MLRVTDPNRIVTDAVLLNVLEDAKVDKDYVEFFQDYAPRKLGKEHSPYAKFYRDLKSGRHFMVTSGLPMIKVEGHPIEPAWFYSEKHGTWYSRANLFSAIVSGNRVELTCLSDQPHGAKAGDKVTYQPQLFLEGKEIIPKSEQPDWLENDPQNENYYQNVLEWDYGICKRRLRIIEGRLTGSWVFSSNPNGTVRIKYNQAGNYKLRLSDFAVNEDTEVIPVKKFDNPEGGYPFTIGDTATFYPDADPETSSVDGMVRHLNDAGDTWANIRGGAGTNAYPSTAGLSCNQLETHTSPNKWVQIRRGILLFDTSGLPDDASDISAILSLYGYNKNDTGSFIPDICVYASTPASNTDLVAADYTQVNSVAFSNVITYANWTTTNYNAFTLNASGLAALTKTGISKYGVRNANRDVADSAPTWIGGRVGHVENYFSEQGNGFKPKLVVTYTPGITTPTVTTQAVSDIGATSATGNGTIVATGGENCTRRGFCYKEGTSGDPTTADSVAYDDGDFGVGVYTKVISGLSPSTSYRVRAYAVNSAGTGYGSTVQMATTTTPTVTTQAVSDIADKSATGNGTVASTGGEDCDKRGICYSSSNSTPTVADSTSEETGSFGTGAFTRPLTGLIRNTKYYVRAYAHNSIGYGYGSVVEFTTLKASTTLAAAQVSSKRKEYIHLLFTSNDGETTEDLSSDSSEYGNRLLLIDHREEAYDDRAYIILRNYDRGIPSDLNGYWTEIGYGDVTGVGNEYIPKPRLWVKHHQEVSIAGKLLTILELQGMWAKLAETLLRVGSPPYYRAVWNVIGDEDYIDAGTIYDIISYLLSDEVNPAMTLAALAEDDGIIDTFQPAFYINDAPKFDDARNIVYTLIKMTKSFIRPKSGLEWEIKYPQSGDSVDLAYSSSESPYFYEYTNRRNLLLPNHIYLFANAGDDGLWTEIITAEATDGDSIAAYGDVYDIILAPEIDNQTDANNRATANLGRQRVEELAGRLVIPHDCRMELYDRVQVNDMRGA